MLVPMREIRLSELDESTFEPNREGAGTPPQMPRPLLVCNIGRLEHRKIAKSGGIAIFKDEILDVLPIIATIFWQLASSPYNGKREDRRHP